MFFLDNFMFTEYVPTLKNCCHKNNQFARCFPQYYIIPVKQLEKTEQYLVESLIWYQLIRSKANVFRCSDCFINVSYTRKEDCRCYNIWKAFNVEILYYSYIIYYIYNYFINLFLYKHKYILQLFHLPCLHLGICDRIFRPLEFEHFLRSFDGIPCIMDIELLVVNYNLINNLSKMIIFTLHWELY